VILLIGTQCQYISNKIQHTHTRVPPYTTLLITRIITRPSLILLHHTHHAPASKIITSLSKSSIPQRLRKDTAVQQLKQIPLSCTTLSLEIPEDPTPCPGFIRIELNLNIATHIILPVLRPCRHRAGFAGTGADPVRPREATLHAGAVIEAVKVGSTIGEGAGPFTHDCPFV
jgi:hypothetical protein